MKTPGEWEQIARDVPAGLAAEELWDEVPAELTLDEKYADATDEELKQLSVKAFHDGFHSYKQALKRLTDSKPPYSQGADTRDTNDLIERVLPFVAWRISRKHMLRDQEVSVMDRIQNGNLYVVNAAQSYDANQEASFVAMFDNLLDDYIMRPERGGIHITSSSPISQSGLIRGPSAKNPYYRVKRVLEGKSKHFSRQLEVEELLDLTEFTERDIETYKDHSIEHVPLHDIEALERESGVAFSEEFIDHDPAVSPHDALDRKTVRPIIDESLDALAPKERAAIRAHTGLDGNDGLTMKETAVELGTSIRDARYQYSHALQKLRALSSIKVFEIGKIKNKPEVDESQREAEADRSPKIELAQETHLTECVRRLLSPKAGGVLKALGKRGLSKEVIFEKAGVHPKYAEEKLRGSAFMTEDEAKSLLYKVEDLVEQELDLSLREFIPPTSRRLLDTTIELIEEEEAEHAQHAM